MAFQECKGPLVKLEQEDLLVSPDLLVKLVLLVHKATVDSLEYQEYLVYRVCQVLEEVWARLDSQVYRELLALLEELALLGFLDLWVTLDQVVRLDNQAYQV